MVFEHMCAFGRPRHTHLTLFSLFIFVCRYAADKNDFGVLYLQILNFVIYAKAILAYMI